MGSAKREMDEEEDRQAEARSICLRAQVFKQCEACFELSLNKSEPEEAYKLGNILFSVSDPHVTHHFSTRLEMTNAIKLVHKQIQEHCRCYMRE